jgi:hypothetical protein
MKPIRLTKHALEQCVERGATEAEVRHAIEHGSENLQNLAEPCAVSISASGKTGKAIPMPSSRLHQL